MFESLGVHHTTACRTTAPSYCVAPPHRHTVAPSHCRTAVMSATSPRTTAPQTSRCCLATLSSHRYIPWLRWGPSIRYATVCVCINYVPVVFGRGLNTVWRTLARLLTTLARLLIKLLCFVLKIVNCVFGSGWPPFFSFLLETLIICWPPPDDVIFLGWPPFFISLTIVETLIICWPPLDDVIQNTKL